MPSPSMQLSKHSPAQHARHTFWRRLRTDPHETEALLGSTRVRVLPLCSYDPSMLQSALQRWNIQVCEDDDAALDIVLVDSYLQSALAVHDRKARTASKPWLLLKASGLEAWLTLLVPDNVCWSCLAWRRRLHEPIVTYLESHTEAPAISPQAYNQGSLVSVYSWSATEVARFFALGSYERLAGNVLTFNVMTGAIEQHRIAPRPYCPDCGYLPAQISIAPRLTELPDLDLDMPPPLDDGPSRDAALQEAHQKIYPQVGQIMGYIWNVRPIDTPHAEGAFHIFGVQHPIATRIPNVATLLTALKAGSSAIGSTEQEAETLALCEAWERLCCLSFNDEPCLRRAYHEVRHLAVVPNAIHLFSPSLFKPSPTNSNTGTARQGLLETLNEDSELAWKRAKNITRDTWCLVPQSSFYFGWTDQDKLYSVADSRGVATGPTLGFCVWKALLELLETDAVAIWHRNYLRKPEVDMLSFGPSLQKLIAVHNALNRDVWALDISADMAGVYIMAVVSRDRDTGNVIKGFGAHLHAHKALERACFECCQMLPNVVSAYVDNACLDKHHRSSDSASSGALARVQVHLVPDLSQPVRTSRFYPAKAAITSLRDLLCILDAKGIDVLIQDISRPEVDLKVTRVFAPGLRPWFNNRYAPGRLYEVPVRMKERDRPITLEAMNQLAVDDWTTTLHGSEVDAFLARQRKYAT